MRLTSRLAGPIRGLRRRIRGSALGTGSDHWLHVRIDGDPDEWRAPGLFDRHPAPTLLDWLRCLEAAADDPRVAGVAFELRGDAASPAAHAALARAIDHLGASGKQTLAWVDGPGLLQFALAARCDRVFAPESARLNLLGLRIEQYYFKDLLDTLDVRPEVVHVGRYKSAGEPVTRRSMSETQREQLEAWQGGLFEGLVAGVSERRGVSEACVRGWIDEALHPARQALEAGMIDGCCYADEIESKIAPSSGGAGRPRTRSVRHVDATRYLALDVRGWDGARSGVGAAVDVAYWVLSGTIGRAGRAGVDLDGFQATAESLRSDDAVRAVVLRVDSPGGDALVSDFMHRELTRLRAAKPVVASFADVAASGGYYLATAADEILAESGSLTGSIGVVGAKVDLSRLYARLGIVKETVAYGARSGMFSEASALGAPERRALRRELGEIYDIFLRRVADGRRLDPAEVERIAQGRVWSGAAACELGLVDRLGGPLEALARARRRAGIESFEHPRLRVLPRPVPWARPLSLLPGG